MSLERLEKIWGRLSMLIVDALLSYLYIIHAGKYWVSESLVLTSHGVVSIMLVVPIVALWMLTLVFFIPEDD